MGKKKLKRTVGDSLLESFKDANIQFVIALADLIENKHVTREHILTAIEEIDCARLSIQIFAQSLRTKPKKKRK